MAERARLRVERVRRFEQHPRAVRGPLSEDEGGARRLSAERDDPEREGAVSVESGLFRHVVRGRGAPEA